MFKMFQDERISIKKFQEYIKISSVNRNVNYEKCIQFLKMYATELSLQIQIITSKNILSSVVISWVGKNPQLASLILSSQMEVEPVCKDQWTRDPFSAEIDEEGNIYGRGTQDIKSIGVQYLEAIRKLQNSKKKLLRTVHVVFLSVPDRGISVDLGMKNFLQNFLYKHLHVGFALDKGSASPDDHYVYFNEERSIWQFEIDCPGLPTHRSTLPDDTAGQKVSYLLNKIYEFRDGEIKKLNENPELSIGDVTTMNVIMLNGVAQVNTLPSVLTIVVDSRIAITADISKIEENVNTWCQEAGEDIKIKNISKSSITALNNVDESNLYWLAFNRALHYKTRKSKRMILPGNSNLRYLREAGVPVIGFSPIVNTPILAQSADEYLNAEVFLNGIDIYYDIILEVANVPKDEYLNDF